MASTRHPLMSDGQAEGLSSSPTELRSEGTSNGSSRPHISPSVALHAPTLPLRTSIPGPTILARLASTPHPRAAPSTVPSSMMPPLSTSLPQPRPPIVASSPTFDELAREVDLLRQQLRAREALQPVNPAPFAWYHGPPTRSDFETREPQTDVPNIRQSSGSRDISIVAPDGHMPVSVHVPLPGPIQSNSRIDQSVNHSMSQGIPAVSQNYQDPMSQNNGSTTFLPQRLSHTI